MQKEKLSLSNIAKDLKLSSNYPRNGKGEETGSYIPVLLILAFASWYYTRSVFLLIGILLIDGYLTLRYVMGNRDYWRKKKEIKDGITRGEIAISVEQFSHMARDSVYEPHRHGRNTHYTKEVRCVYFLSGGSWRVPSVVKHYRWSREYFLSSQGMENISLVGDEFYYVSLKGYPEIAYIYPCKFFELDESLKESASV